jgi:hypothetical protein
VGGRFDPRGRKEVISLQGVEKKQTILKNTENFSANSVVPDLLFPSLDQGILAHAGQHSHAHLGKFITGETILFQESPAYFYVFLGSQ